MGCLNRLFIIAALISLCLLPSMGQSRSGQKSAAQEEAADYYAKWLNEDVVYLISDEERDVFQGLTTADEKDTFIEEFWRRRDPDPASAFNEYREEHYRRIAYANQHFGSGIPGWKTDRGRIYIMFGPPDESEYHSGGQNYTRAHHEGGGRTSTYPFEIWRYRQISGVGSDVEMEFVDRSWTGEFRLALYPWEKDMLLHVDGAGETTAERFGRARRYERPGLHPGHLNNSSWMIRHMGQRFKDRPFERLAQYYALQKPPAIRQKELQQIVSAHVSFQSLPFSTLTHEISISEDAALVSLTIEVPNSALKYVRTNSGGFKARVGLYGRLTGMLGEYVTEFDDLVASEYSEAHLEAGRLQRSLYQKTLLMEPGRYKLELAVKDLNSGDLGTRVESIRVSKVEPERLQAGAVILAKQIAQLDDFPENPQSFVIGDVRVVPNVERKYRSSEELGVYMQVYNPSLDASTLLPSVSVEYRITSGDRVISKFTDLTGSSISYAAGDRLVLQKELKLELLENGRYRLTVQVNDAVSGQSSSSEAEFEVIEG